MLRSFLRNNLSNKNKQLLRQGLRCYPLSTSRIRTLPDWLVIGAQKSGTTSLYFYLMQHPQNCFALPDIKEPQFFNKHYNKGINYYRSHFPLRSLEFLRSLRLSQYQTREATPEYLFHHFSPARAYQLVPNAKLIVVLRNPVERAYSHWNMIRTKGQRVETLSFEDAVDAETERIQPEYEKMLADPINFSWSGPLEWFSYVERGKYVDQIENWLKYFPKDQILILKSEDFLAEPQKNYFRVTQFLGLKPYEKIDFGTTQVGTYKSKMPSGVREKLVETFKPYNERLQKYVDWSIDWD